MRTKILILTLVAATCLLAQTSVAKSLKLYLPRQVKITGDTMLLGEIAVMHGGSAEETAKISAIQLGKFSKPGQVITVDRRTIQGRLTANKINAKSVTFTGAKSITVGRKEMVVSKDEITAKAEKFLKENKTNSSIASYKLARVGEKIVIPGHDAKVSIVPRLGKRVSPSQTTVDVDVMVGGKKIGTNQVIYRPMYNCRRFIAKTDLPAGTVISSDNTKMETVESTIPEPRNWQSPIGLVVRRKIRIGQLIRNSQVEKARPPILIERNSLVVIKTQIPGLTVTASGQSLGEGAIGEMIKVKNIDSKKIIICKVNYDGSVSPVI